MRDATSASCAIVQVPSQYQNEMMAFTLGKITDKDGHTKCNLNQIEVNMKNSFSSPESWGDCQGMEDKVKDWTKSHSIVMGGTCSQSGLSSYSYEGKRGWSGFTDKNMRSTTTIQENKNGLCAILRKGAQ